MTKTGGIAFRDYELGYAWRARLGETQCGDAVWARVAEEELRVAVFDGLGHGPDAALASATGVGVVATASWADLARLMTECDRAMRSTRGAAVSLLRIRSEGAAEHCGVGNIALVGRGKGSKGAYSRPGIVGARPRSIVVDRFLVEPGESLAIYTDGLSQSLRPCEPNAEAIEDCARRLILDWGKEHDDASCVVIRRRVDA